VSSPFSEPAKHETKRGGQSGHPMKRKKCPDLELYFYLYIIPLHAPTCTYTHRSTLKVGQKVWTLAKKLTS